MLHIVYRYERNFNSQSQLRIDDFDITHIPWRSTNTAVFISAGFMLNLIRLLWGRVAAVRVVHRQGINYHAALLGQLNAVGGEVLVLVGIVEVVTGLPLFAV